MIRIQIIICGLFALIANVKAENINLDKFELRDYLVFVRSGDSLDEVFNPSVPSPIVENRNYLQPEPKQTIISTAFATAYFLDADEDGTGCTDHTNQFVQSTPALISEECSRRLVDLYLRLVPRRSRFETSVLKRKTECLISSGVLKHCAKAADELYRSVGDPASRKLLDEMFAEAFHLKSTKQLDYKQLYSKLKQLDLTKDDFDFNRMVKFAKQHMNDASRYENDFLLLKSFMLDQYKKFDRTTKNALNTATLAHFFGSDHQHQLGLLITNEQQRLCLSLLWSGHKIMQHVNRQFGQLNLAYRKRMGYL